MEYLPTKLGHKYGVNVGKYSSTMDPMEMLIDVLSMEHWGMVNMGSSVHHE